MSQLQQPAKLPTGLAALVALQRTASATTPDGAPTVAAQMAEKAKAEMRGQGQPPQGIGQEAPPMEGQDVQDTAQQAGIAGQIGMDKQKAVQEAMAKMVQLPKPEGPLQLARGGIAALPADNMHNMGRYAHGGVIGFSGPISSVDEAVQKAGREAFLAEQTESSGSSGTLTAEQQAALAEIVRGKVPKTNKATTPYTAATKQLGESLIARGGVDKPSGLEQFTPEQRSELAGKLLTGAKQTADVKDAEAAKVKSGINVPARQQAQPAQFAQADQMAALERPNLGETFSEVENLIGKVSTKKSDKLQEERETLTGERTKMLDEKIAAMKAGTASRQALEKERQGNVQGQKIRAWLTGMSENYRGRGGDEVNKVTAEDFKTRQLMAQADTADALAITEERKANLAARIGDKDQQMAAEKAAQDAKMKSKEIIARTVEHVITSKTNLYMADARALEVQWNAASAEKRQTMADNAAMARERFTRPDIALAENLAKEMAGGKTPTTAQRVAATLQVLELNPQYRVEKLKDAGRQAAARTAAFKQIADAKKAFLLQPAARGLKAGSPEFEQAERTWITNTAAEAVDLLGQTPQGGAAAPAAPAAPRVLNSSDIGKKV
jgi:hypothetical protein